MVDHLAQGLYFCKVHLISLVLIEMGVDFVANVDHLTSNLFPLVLSIFEFLCAFDEFSIEICIPLTEQAEPLYVFLDILLIFLYSWDLGVIELVNLSGNCGNLAILEGNFVLDLITKSGCFLHSFICDCTEFFISFIDDVNSSSIKLALYLFKFC